MALRRGKPDERGRVWLQMRGGSASPLVIQAAVRVARTFQGELHGLFIEDEELLALADMPFAREVSIGGTRSRTLSPALLHREMQAASTAMDREFARLARAAHIPARLSVIRGLVKDAMTKAVEEGIGILAIGEPLALAGPRMISGLLSDLSHVAGIVVVGCNARRAEGPVVTVIDPAADVAHLVDTSEQLADEGGESVIVLIVSMDDAEARRLEEQVRAALGAETRAVFERSGTLNAAALGALARHHRAGLVVAHAGGPVALDDEHAARFACALECPMLLLRGCWASAGKAPSCF